MGASEWRPEPLGRHFKAMIAGSVMLAVLGIAIAAYGRSIPVFSADRETVEQALLAWCPDGFNVDRAAGERYLALFTRHYAWVVLLAIYLLTSTRAALLSPKQGDAADDCR